MKASKKKRVEEKTGLAYDQWLNTIFNLGCDIQKHSGQTVAQIISDAIALCKRRKSADMIGCLQQALHNAKKRK
jgi:hypothetical protein